jgi:hypothetical protein
MRDFNSAFASLSAGNKARRASWPKGNYVFIKKHRNRRGYLTSYSAKFNREDSEVLHWDDLTATDWEIVG